MTNNIFKTWKKGTYLKGSFYLRDKNSLYARPIEFPTVFRAHGRAIKSGNWERCKIINTPDYVIDNYFDTIGRSKHDAMFQLFEVIREIDKITWEDVAQNKDKILDLINQANNELLKLKQL